MPEPHREDAAAKKSNLPTFPLRSPDTPPAKPKKDTSIPRVAIIWLLVMTLLLAGEAVYLVQRNMDLGKNAVINRPPAITAPGRTR